MKKPIHWLAMGLGSLAGIVGASYYFLIRRPLPPKKGVRYLDGIRESVEVIRDQWGVPHIYAHHELDLFFTQGYVHAQDRLWQLDFNRRLASGRTAEILGKQSIPLDRWMRTLSFRQVAEKETALLDPLTLNMLQAYSEGINARIEEGRLPVEFNLLRYKPEKWTILDSLGWTKMMAWYLSVNWESEILRAQLITAVGPEKAAALEPEFLYDIPTILPKGIDYSYMGSEALQRVHDARNSLGSGPHEGFGSNNWVVSGQRSQTGKPIFANDMHLGMSAPSIWYENHLVGGSYNLSGITFPGIPGIIAGHNGHVAWGYTNGFPDVQDLFIEHIKADQAGIILYEFKGEWRKADIRNEEIKVKGGDTVIEKIITTHHGPIINCLSPDLCGEEPLALRWTALDPGGTMNCLLPTFRARNCSELKEALREWTVPSQNTVYADIDGNYFYSLTGKIPIREKGNGRVPVPGWTGEYEWAGYIPFEDLPHLCNPKEGYIYSANNRVVCDDYPYYLGYDHCSGNRAQRIKDLLEANEHIDARYVMQMQMDQVSIAAQRTIASIRKLSLNDPDLDHVLSRLFSWDGKLGVTSPEAAVYEVFIRFMIRELLQSMLGELTDQYMGKGPTPVIGEGSIFGDRSREWLQNFLADPSNSILLDQIQADPLEVIIIRTMKQAVGFLKKSFGSDMDNWGWGKLHSLTFNHVLGAVKPLDALFNRGAYPIGGDSDTICASSSGFYKVTNNSLVSAPFRFIADLSNLDNSLGCLVPGQSGQPSSKHYADNIQDWFDGKYHPMLYRRESVEKYRNATFWLEPTGT